MSKPMTCVELEPHARDAARAGQRELPAELRERLAAHLRICPTCTARLARERRLDAALLTLAREEEAAAPPPALPERLRQRFREQMAAATPGGKTALPPCDGAPSPLPLPAAAGRGRTIVSAPASGRSDVSAPASANRSDVSAPASAGDATSAAMRSPDPDHSMGRPSADEPKPSRLFALAPRQRGEGGERGLPHHRRLLIAAAAAAALAALLLFRATTPSVPVVTGNAPHLPPPAPAPGLEERAALPITGGPPVPGRPVARLTPLGWDAQVRPIEIGRIARIRLPTSVAVHFGWPVLPDAPEARVAADVLIGEDGTARALRFLPATFTPISPGKERRP